MPWRPAVTGWVFRPWSNGLEKFELSQREAVSNYLKSPFPLDGGKVRMGVTGWCSVAALGSREIQGWF